MDKDEDEVSLTLEIMGNAPAEMKHIPITSVSVEQNRPKIL